MIRLTLALLLAAGAAQAGTATIRDGIATSSALRGLTAYGDRPTDWTRTMPAPSATNTDAHFGRAAGTFEDRGMGGIAGEVRADANGRATIVVQDLYDADRAGRLEVTTGGETVTLTPERGENGNTRVIDLRGLRTAWNTFKLRWVGASRSGHGPNGAQDGWSVCR